MGEMIQKKFREILDSVSNASDDFVNKYFSDDSVDLDIKVSEDTEDNNDWFDYKGNLISDDDDENVKQEENDNYEEINDNKSESVEETNPLEELKPIEEIKEDKTENNTVNEEIESSIGENIDLSSIEKDIKKTTYEELDLNFNYDELEEKEIKKENLLEEIEESNVDEKKEEVIVENKNDTIETVKDTSYKKLSGDELINLLNKIDNGEDFFKEVEVK